ncbi:MAG: FCD domain-containing protein [Anaerolineaceae bacterium]
MTPTLKRDLLEYLAEAQVNHAEIPSIPEISQTLGISVANVREQLEVARCLGFVDVKPKVGIQSRSFSLTQPLVLGMRYGVKVQPGLFAAYSDLRKHIETSYWYEAVSLLTTQDIDKLEQLVTNAKKKIQEKPIQVPEIEHRTLHLTIFHRLDNPVVQSILETYWDLYEDLEYNYYLDQTYLETVWNYHQTMVDALAAHEFEKGYLALTTHMDLFQQRKKAELRQRFE